MYGDVFLVFIFIRERVGSCLDVNKRNDKRNVGYVYDVIVYCRKNEIDIIIWIDFKSVIIWKSRK